MVSGYSRVPEPPARMMPFIDLASIAAHRECGYDRPMKTLKEMIAEARQVVPEEAPADLERRLKSGEPLTVIDVRDPDEYRDGHIEAATNISRGFLEFRVATVATDPA